MPLRSSSTSVTVEPVSSTTTVISWLGATSVKASVPSTVPSSVNCSVKPPLGRPRSVNEPSGATTAVMAGFSTTLTISWPVTAQVVAPEEAPVGAPSSVPVNTTPEAPAVADGAAGLPPPPQALRTASAAASRPMLRPVDLWIGNMPPPRGPLLAEMGTTLSRHFEHAPAGGGGACPR